MTTDDHGLLRARRIASPSLTLIRDLADSIAGLTPQPPRRAKEDAQIIIRRETDDLTSTDDPTRVRALATIAQVVHEAQLQERPALVNLTCPQITHDNGRLAERYQEDAK